MNAYDSLNEENKQFIDYQADLLISANGVFKYFDFCIFCHNDDYDEADKFRKELEKSHNCKGAMEYDEDILQILDDWKRSEEMVEKSSYIFFYITEKFNRSPRLNRLKGDLLHRGKYDKSKIIPVLPKNDQSLTPVGLGGRTEIEWFKHDKDENKIKNLFSPKQVESTQRMCNSEEERKEKKKMEEKERLAEELLRSLSSNDDDDSDLRSCSPMTWIMNCDLDYEDCSTTSSLDDVVRDGLNSRPTPESLQKVENEEREESGYMTSSLDDVVAVKSLEPICSLNVGYKENVEEGEEENVESGEKLIYGRRKNTKAPEGFERNGVAVDLNEQFLSKPIDTALADKEGNQSTYHAEDKIALLIGNGNYLNFPSLASPPMNVKTLTDVLTELNFKVISLIDLNFDETLRAIKMFCSFLRKGVYGFFYYAGHGYQCKKQSYLLHPDSPTEYNINESVCADYIQAEMVKCDPALVVLIFDMCRTQPDAISKLNPEQITPAAHPNFMILFSVLPCQNAHEKECWENSIFTTYLIKNIRENKSLKMVIDNTITDVNAARGKLQNPDLNYSLRDAHSLMDEIKPKFKFEALNRDKDYKQLLSYSKGFIWTKGLPDGLKVEILLFPHNKTVVNAVDIEVKLHFHRAYHHSDVQLFLENEVKGQKQQQQQLIPHKGVSSIMHLQKIKENLRVRVKVVDERSMECIAEKVVDMKKQLIMRSQRWQNTELTETIGVKIVKAILTVIMCAFAFAVASWWPGSANSSSHSDANLVANQINA